MVKKKKVHIPKTLDDLKAAEYNPRTITDAAAGGLSVSTKEFGDISGITFNKTTGQLVTGHQRVAVLRERGGELVLVDKNKMEIHVGKNVFPVRMVAWSLAKEQAANVSANNPNIGGDFIDDDLNAMLEGIQEDCAAFEDLRFDELLGSVSVPNFDSIHDDEQPRLDEKKKIECPECGHEFTT